MDRYQKVEKPKPVLPTSENEVRITSQGLISNYLSYAITLLRDQGAKEIVLKAMGQAINKTVAIAEILKRKIPNLHQDTAISSISMTDTWEPIEEGLVPVELTRHVSMISITLSTRQLKKNSPGYQPPQVVEQQKPRYESHQQQLRQPRGQYNAANNFNSYDRGRDFGRGRGRSFNRGGYGNYRDGNYRGGNYQGGNYRDGNYQNRNYQNGTYQNGNYRDGNYQSGNYRDGNYRNGNYRDGNYQNGNYGDGNYRNGNYRDGNYRNGNYQDNDGYNQNSNWSRGGDGGRSWANNGNYQGGGNFGGRGGGYVRGRGRMGVRGRGN